MSSFDRAQRAYDNQEPEDDIPPSARCVDCDEDFSDDNRASIETLRDGRKVLLEPLCPACFNAEEERLKREPLLAAIVKVLE